MRNERRKQAFTLAILIVTILSVSIGFAAFSATLRISSSATVTPNEESFIVKFSTTNNAITTGTVSPILHPSTETSNLSKNVSATTITVDGSTTLTGLSATFISPGDYVTYKVYAVNEGSYNAYLNNVNFLGSKTCTAGEGASQTLVDAACNGISVSVSVAGTSYNSTTGITGHKLSKGTGEEILVTIKYDSNSARADGPFSINLGEVRLVYSTTDDSKFTPKKVCTLIDNDSSGDATKSDIVTCTKDNISESFYVVDNINGNVNMLSKYNITLSETSPIQDTSGTVNGITFSSRDYWWDSTSSTYTTEFLNQGRTYPYIYDSRADKIYPYIEAYRDVLEEMGVNVKDAKLMSYEQAINLGCSETSCSSAPSWVRTSAYWLGSAYNIDRVWYVHSNNSFNAYDFSFGTAFGVRPLITIYESDLG